jgi:folate-binding protein YgfZ
MNPEDLYPAYDAARRHAALVRRDDRAWVVVSGRDRATYLQGLLTNDIPSLQGGQGCYAAYLTPQGRMIADLWVYELGDVMLLSMIADVKATVLSKLDQFIFGEDVQLGDVTTTFAALAVVGPAAALAVAPLLGLEEARVSALPEHGNLRAAFREQPAILLRTTDLGEPGFDLLVEASLFPALVGALHEGGARDVDRQVAEALRIEGGVPKFHQDMDEDTLPLEAGIEARAISLTKGCYVGQEVIIRVLHRGHGRVARKLVGLAFDGGDAPVRSATIQVDGRVVGEVTSATWSPALGRPIALGYVQRECLAPGTRVTVDSGGAEVVALPFVRQ